MNPRPRHAAIIKILSAICAVIISILPSLVTPAFATSIKDITGNEIAYYKKIGNINVVSLSGSYSEMGNQYGTLMREQLQKTYHLLENFYIKQNNISYSALLAEANLFYNRYPYSYQLFLQNMAAGSGLSLDQCKILNAMETLRALVKARTSTLSQCAFLSIPPNMTYSKKNLIGRNYDYSAPFNEIAKELTVTILKADKAIPTAIISMPGQIYCPTCINANGIFMELNNGMPSGGYYVDASRQSLLIKMLEALQKSDQLEQVDTHFKDLEADYSLIVNVANRSSIRSYEFSSTLGMNFFTPMEDKVFVSTNFYLNPIWKNIPVPSDDLTWMGVTRRNNLLSLANAQDKIDVSNMQKLMDKTIAQGGGAWEHTIYQIIYDTSDQALYLKINNAENSWTKIPLKEFFVAR